jgi:hypothetical protein
MTSPDQGWRKVAQNAAMASFRRRPVVGPVIGPVIGNVLSPLRRSRAATPIERLYSIGRIRSASARGEKHRGHNDAAPDTDGRHRTRLQLPLAPAVAPLA